MHSKKEMKVILLFRVARRADKKRKAATQCRFSFTCLRISTYFEFSITDVSNLAH